MNQKKNSERFAELEARIEKQNKQLETLFGVVFSFIKAQDKEFQAFLESKETAPAPTQNVIGFQISNKK